MHSPYKLVGRGKEIQSEKAWDQFNHIIIEGKIGYPSKNP